MNRTSIEWCDLTWNPIRARLKQFPSGTSGGPSYYNKNGSRHSGTFCTRISPGCTNCYASVINKRFGNGLDYSVPNLPKVEFFIDEKILAEPLRRKKPARIFVGDMFDLFHEAIDVTLVGRVFGMMGKCPQHTFQVLTKRASYMHAILSRVVKYNDEYIHWPMPHVWLGVSVESQKYADERIPLLLQTPAAVRFLSVEPMLEAVDLVRSHLQIKPYFSTPGIDWVICGGESGPGARPFNLAWAESLLEQCKAAGVPFFMKQVGSNPEWPNEYWQGFAEPLTRDRKGGDPAEWPEPLRVRQFPRVQR